MNQGFKRTAYFLFALAVAALCWEAYTLLNDWPGDTISDVMAYAGGRWPLPVVGGLMLLMGHWFWSVGGKG